MCGRFVREVTVSIVAAEYGVEQLSRKHTRNRGALWWPLDSMSGGKMARMSIIEKFEAGARD